MPRKTSSTNITRAKKAIAKKMNSTTAKGARVHIVSHKSKWAVRLEGSQKAYRVCSSKSSALRTAKHLVKNGRTNEIVIHKKDGSIERQFKSSSLTDDKVFVAP
ncbi:MAG: DUF2188 domain-containing protein [Candidatus Zixiibacteriota bacterium]